MLEVVSTVLQGKVKQSQETVDCFRDLSFHSLESNGQNDPSVSMGHEQTSSEKPSELLEFNKKDKLVL